MSLHQLIDALLFESPETPAWQTALERLVNQLLRERQVARRQKGKPLSGIYKEIHDAIKDELLTQIQAIALSENCHSKLTTAWLRSTLRQVSQTVITYGHLTRLALALQQQVHKSPDWQYASSELFNAVLRSDKLRQPSWMAKHSAILYEDVRNNAMEYAVRNIARFNPDKSHFAGWINQICLEMHGRNSAFKDQDTLRRGYLGRIKSTKARLSSVIRTREFEPTLDYLRYHIQVANDWKPGSDYLAISITLLHLKCLMVNDHTLSMQLLYEISKQSIDRPVSLQSMDAEIQYDDGDSHTADIRASLQNSASPPLAEFLIQCLLSCSKGSCQTVLEEHVRGYPEATFRAIALYRAQEKRWRDISDALGIPVPTLSAHYGRRIDKVLPCLKDCLDDQVELWKMQNGS